MARRFLSGLGLAGALLAAAPALAQQAAPSRTAEEFATILGAGGGRPALTADQFAAILAPPAAMPRTRSIWPGAGTEPGAPGSGVVPDLKVNFATNSATLTPGAKATLGELGKALQLEELRPLRFEIAGHTDAKGSLAHNEKLSQRRAAAVVAFLTQNAKVEQERLKAIGYGPKRLLDPEDPASWVNRRVEIRRLD